MEKSKVFQLIKELPFDKKTTLYQKENTQIYLLRPSKLSKKFKDYDLKKNFQVWLKEGNREFRPNHMRVFIDLNLRVRSRPDLKKELLIAFDNIFYGKDPEAELQKLSKEKFEHYLNDLTAIGLLAQLFIIEQEYNYNKVSKFDPSTLFFQGWIREVIDAPKEIDNLCMSIASRQSSLEKYTNLENKKSKKHHSNLKQLWYLSE